METLKQTMKNISNLTGEFKDSALEYDFHSYILQETISYSRRYILTFGFLFLLFFIPDYFLIKDINQLIIIFLIRILFLLVSVLYYLHLPYMKSFLYLLSTIYESIGIIFLWALFLSYEQPNIVIHQQGLIVFILAIFLILPNSFINKVFLSICLTSGFFYIAAIRKIISLSSSSAGLITFTLVIILFCAFAARLINQLQRAQFQNTQTLERLSATDTLTGIYNRMKYDQDLEKEITRAQRYNLFLSGIMFDLDNFKQINDEYGHLIGDQVLIQLTSHIKGMIRANDRLYRWGGEEFIILLPNTDQEAAVQLAKRIKSHLEKIDFLPAAKITCSFGVITWQEDENAFAFTNRLDQLQYQAKKRGKNCIVFE